MAEVDGPAGQWSVEPHPFQFSLSGWREHTKGCSTAGGLGCVSIIIVGILAGIMLQQFPDKAKSMSSGAWWFIAVGTTVLLLLMMSLIAYYSRATARSKREAAAAATEARVRFKDIGVQSNGITTSVERALFYLNVADREFVQHRYAPFWDAMESAATAIGQCHVHQTRTDGKSENNNDKGRGTNGAD